MREWKMIGRTLGLDESDILEIEDESRHRTKECVYQMLSKWKSHSRLNTATNLVLHKALLELDLLAAAGSNTCNSTSNNNIQSSFSTFYII